MQQKLILLSGEAWTGKSTVARLLYSQLDNSAWLDGDDVWRVNPWRVDDPRLRNSDLNMAYILTNYLQSKFQYVILSSIVLCVDALRERIIRLIDYTDYAVIHITLLCDPTLLVQRAKTRDDNQEPTLLFHELSKTIQGSIKLDTSTKRPEALVAEIMQYL
ncbi:MAG: hypothetical protein KF832_30400 [Caldilineaceae bacterium]|nr:hypothetical protein [Caldilineaceae bacterium]